MALHILASGYREAITPTTRRSPIIAPIAGHWYLLSPMDLESVDVAIIGGGPAGCTAATLLRAYDPERRIAIFEQSTFPRHHVGESTLPDMNAILAKLGVLPKIDSAGFVRKTGITYRWRVDQPMFSEVFAKGVLDALGPAELPDYSWQVDRSRYDQILLEHARERGVMVHEGTRVDGILREEDRVVGLRTHAGGRAREVRAGHVVDCSGQARVLSRLLGLTKQSHALGDLAVYRYYRGMRWSEPVGSPTQSKIFFSATPAGWMWFIPLSESDVSVGLVTRREFLDAIDADSLFESELATVPEMVWMLQPASRCAAPGTNQTGTITVADWSYSHERPCGAGYYLAGDSAAFIDPILSSGILLAHQSGLMVANAIHTEWHDKEISREELHDGYSRFYSDLYAGFLVMADWWYRKRKVSGIDEWLKRAVALGQAARGSGEISTTDTESFMTFAAGYLTDFRFVNLGIGFGDEGLRTAIDGLENQAPRRPASNQDARYRRAFDRAEVGAYLATDVDTDRWHRLPLVRFFGDFGERIYRPPIPLRHYSEARVVTALRIIERVTAACDGRRTVEQAIHAVSDSLPGEYEPATLASADRTIRELAMLGVFRSV
jgi:flavin-dependent dehydrogenase